MELLTMRQYLVVLTFVCGMVCPNFAAPWSDEFIIGGTESSKGAWPWMLSLERLRITGEYSHTCGATLLTDTFVLTAAHCLWPRDQNVTNYRVRFGAFNLTADDHDDLVYAKQLILHDDFDFEDLGTGKDDIGLVELETPIDLTNPNIGLVKLPRRGDNFTNNPNCIISGWGRYDPDLNEISPILKELDVQVHSYQECLAIWESSEFPEYMEFLDERNICLAGPFEGSCNGDSGGPLNCDVTGLGDWVQAGITSWGAPNCQGATSVYCGTESLLDWVEERVPGLPGVKP